MYSKFGVFSPLLATIIMFSAGYGQEEPVSAALAEQLQARLNAQLNVQNFVGVSAAVISGEHGYWEGAAGFNNPNLGEDMDASLLCGFASITKTYVAAIILQLAEEGLLSLDDSLHNWFDPIDNVDPDITIRQILNHTSGIYNYTDDPSLFEQAFADLDRWWTPQDILDTFVHAPNFDPGTSWGYSNTNYILLGMIIQFATGNEVFEEMNTRLWDPLGLEISYLTGEEEPTTTLSTPWVDIDGNGTLDDFSAYYRPAFHSLRWTAGGMFSVPGEVAKWAYSLFGDSVLEPASLDEMLDFVWINGGTWNGYGLGVMRYTLSETDLWGHNGGISGYYSSMYYSAEYDVAIALITNCNIGNTVTAVHSLLNGVIEYVPSDISSEMPIQPKAFQLRQNYPNPFNPATTINLELSFAGEISLIVYDISGQLVRNLMSGSANPGVYEISWDGMDNHGNLVSSGVYFYSLRYSPGLGMADNFVQTRKMLLTR